MTTVTIDIEKLAQGSRAAGGCRFEIMVEVRSRTSGA
jgi:hypothetical protein